MNKSEISDSLQKELKDLDNKHRGGTIKGRQHQD